MTIIRLVKVVNIDDLPNSSGDIILVIIGDEINPKSNTTPFPIANSINFLNNPFINIPSTFQVIFKYHFIYYFINNL